MVISRNRYFFNPALAIMEKKIDVYIVDDHQIVIDGIKLLLLNAKKIRLCGEANSGKELLEMLTEQTPDVILLDLILPDVSGVELIEEIKVKYPDIKIIVFTGNTPDQLLFQAIEAGVSGILLKTATQEEIIKAIREVYEDKNYLGEKITNKIFTTFLKKTRYKEKPFHGLTKRELEVIQQVAKGLTYKEIGYNLNISTHTVEAHKNNILRKLKLKNVVELVKYCIKNNIISL